MRQPAKAPGGGHRRLLGDDGLLQPYLFLLPHAVFFLVFLIYPLFKGFYVSFTEWDTLRNSGTWTGLANYLKLFDPSTIQNAYYWRALGVTLTFVAISVPPLVLSALGLAVLVSGPLPGRSFFRTVFFLPTALTVSVVAIMWRWIFQSDVGLLNAILRLLGLPGKPWLTTQPWAWIALLVTTIWWTVGWNMVLLISGLNNIPEDLYEAAGIDGASSWQSFRFITLPNLRPILLLVSVLTVIASFNLFGQPQLMTGGGPDRSTLPVMLLIYQEAFGAYRMGVSAAMAYFTGLIMLLATFLQTRIFAQRADY
ncbi:MAG: carbohydrate ABC transporter permease [Bacteroidota bacterium]